MNLPDNIDKAYDVFGASLSTEDSALDPRDIVLVRLAAALASGCDS